LANILNQFYQQKYKLFGHTTNIEELWPVVGGVKKEFLVEDIFSNCCADAGDRTRDAQVTDLLA